jgi:3-keto-5-aminohexanoate cleavage enzyme
MVNWIQPEAEEVKHFITEMHGMSEHLVTEPKYTEMNKKLIINIAPNGATISHLDNPYMLREPEPIIEETIECYKAGASIWHTHLRVGGIRTHYLENYLKAFDIVAKEANDLIYSYTAIADLKQMDRRQISPLLEPLTKQYGIKYCELVLESPITYSCGNFFVQPMTEAAAIDQIVYLQSLGIKPEIQVRNLDHMARFQRFFIDSGVLKKPYLLNVCSGTHDAAPTGPNPWGFVNMIMQWNSFPKKDAVIGLVAGERNWLPITILGIMLGVDAVRIGMEEPIYMYPHKDEMIKRNVDTVKKVTAIAKELSRDIAKPDEARKILGLKPRTW